MSTKHTPGEWKAANKSFFSIGNDHRFVVKTPLFEPAIAFGITLEEAEANSRLISAAPDLLEACELLLKMAGEVRINDLAGDYDFMTPLEKGELAIRKAYGPDPNQLPLF